MHAMAAINFQEARCTLDAQCKNRCEKNNAAAITDDFFAGAACAPG